MVEVILTDEVYKQLFADPDFHEAEVIYDHGKPAIPGCFYFKGKKYIPEGAQNEESFD